MRHWIGAAALAATLAGLAGAPARAEAELVEVKGEVIDTWCYFSGVMGGQDAVVGSAHHTCALWCAAAGIPVGLLTETGEVYMILKLGDDDDVAGGDAILDLQSDVITAKGRVYPRDGLNYLVVDTVLANDGITTINHEDFGVVPPNAIPKSVREQVINEGN